MECLYVVAVQNYFSQLLFVGSNSYKDNFKKLIFYSFISIHLETAWKLWISWLHETDIVKF